MNLDNRIQNKESPGGICGGDINSTETTSQKDKFQQPNIIGNRETDEIIQDKMIQDEEEQKKKKEMKEAYQAIIIHKNE